MTENIETIDEDDEMEPIPASFEEWLDLTIEPEDRADKLFLAYLRAAWLAGHARGFEDGQFK